MADDRIPEKELWAYVHGQGSARDREELERRIGEDVALRERLASIRTLHGHLQASLQGQVLSEEYLEEQVVTAWEVSNTEPEKTNEAKPEVEIGSPGRQSTSRGGALYWAPILALAATVAIAVGVYHYASQPDLLWSSPVIATAAFRGEVGPEGWYEQTKLEGICHEMRDAVEAAYGRLVEDSVEATVCRWRITTRLQELGRGAFSLSMKGVTRDRQPAMRDWSFDFVDYSSFAARKESLAVQMATELIASSER